MSDADRTVAIVTLGCARNEVDSEELAGRLAAEGWTLVEDPADAAAVLVNTCGFIEAAKKDSIDTILSVAEGKERGATKAVVAAGCLAERYGEQLASALPEADSVLSFDDYPLIAKRLQDAVEGVHRPAHAPQNRRRLLPIAPVARAELREEHASRVPGWIPSVPRIRLSAGVTAPVKLASGCDRRCSFCAIPSFRGSFVSRAPAEVLAEVSVLAASGVREVVLVSENSTSYGKDLGDLRLLEQLLASLAGTVPRIRVAYLQPAEVRPTLLDAIAGTQGIAPYFDLSFQHSSARILRAMRRFGGTADFLELVGAIRERDPRAGIRSNVILGFPGEHDEDVEELAAFLESARLDAVGVFGYSDEDGTEAADLPGKVPQEEIDARVDRISRLVEELMAQRAEERIGEVVEVLVERREDGIAIGRSAHQGPEDGETLLPDSSARPGEVAIAIVTGSEGVDLVAGSPQEPAA